MKPAQDRICNGAEHNSPWKDGFLFVGNRLALDFLNTRPVQNDRPIELLPDLQQRAFRMPNEKTGVDKCARLARIFPCIGKKRAHALEVHPATIDCVQAHLCYLI